MEYKTTYYSYVLGQNSDDTAKALDCYRKLLKKDYDSSYTTETMERYFKEFVADSVPRVKKLYWGQLWEILTSDKPEFFKNYMESLEGEFDDKDRQAIQKRFKGAGIPIN
jgi:hypothetical protein